MAMIINKKKGSFWDKVVDFPFMRVAIFAAIAGAVFYLLAFKPIGQLFLFVIPMAIIARIFTLWLCAVEHPVTKFMVASLFASLEFLTIGGSIMMAFIEADKDSAVAVISGVFLLIGGLALFLAAMAFLVRVFIALFM